jgi:hypothetical protein
MSSTRRAKDDSVFHQGRYASAPEFERGLMANLVAKRCALIDDAAGREIIWFLHHLSHRAGGVAAVAKTLIEKYGERLQTPAMASIGMKPGKILNADQVKTVREEIPHEIASRFPLKGEADFLDIISRRTDMDEDESAAADRALARAMFLSAGTEDASAQKANLHPRSYPAQEFLVLCREAAQSKLEKYLRELCVNPASELDAGPWYFPGLIATLREYQTAFVQAKIAGAVTTALGQKVCEVLDYTFYSRGLTLIQGEARLGKSHAARHWAAQHPGRAPFVEVPPSNDEASFFRALARGLGIGNFLQYKVTEIRERVESVLLTGDLLLILDEAHRLWPQRNLRYGFPSRINWVMAMANHNVPICAIATPQFIEWQKAAEERGQWNSAQLTGRISHFEPLPAELSEDDLKAVAKAVLPEANAQVLRALAVYARSSARYLAAIDSISKRARYIAQRAGRAAATTDDVRQAMQESVIPADTKLHRALEAGRKGRSARMAPVPATAPAPTEPTRGTEVDAEEILPAHSRLAPMATVSRRHSADLVPA